MSLFSAPKKFNFDALNLSSKLTDTGAEQFVGPLSPSNYVSPVPKYSDFDLNKFEDLLQRLEKSKKQQVTQKGKIARGNIYAAGIANMMSNF